MERGKEGGRERGKGRPNERDRKKEDWERKGRRAWEGKGERGRHREREGERSYMDGRTKQIEVPPIYVLHVCVPYIMSLAFAFPKF